MPGSESRKLRSERTAWVVAATRQRLAQSSRPAIDNREELDARAEQSREEQR
jgi:hypothetical protein